ncbi:MAG TPA: aminotransferase class V-fold PLP-dependent enzyme [Gemmataceae bacterium]|nr:aminotransferase class V-fold PLP-dependent enzyme [Gemmataceae bacterium]
MDDHARHWRIRPDTTYLNHGSFGPPPESVREAQRRWKDRLDEQPMDFFVRLLPPAWIEARDRLGRFVGTSGENLVFVGNATVAMNVVADSVRLGPGDEVLLNDHEYGAVVRIWERACRRAGAEPPRVVKLPGPFESAEQIEDALFAAVLPRTKMLVVSHITSPTAVIFPVDRICARARREGILTCIDGPHAPAQVTVDIDRIGCDYYCASLHKWLSAPFGSGFVHAARKHHAAMEPAVRSWGRQLPNPTYGWADEFMWVGSYDPSPYLTVPAAIDFLEAVGLDAFRSKTHELAQYARHRLVELTGLTPIVPDSPEWYGTMAHVPLPPGDARELQNRLWTEHQIEVPIVAWNEGRYIRVSCHLYNDRAQIDRLVDVLRPMLACR